MRISGTKMEILTQLQESLDAEQKYTVEYYPKGTRGQQNRFKVALKAVADAHGYSMTEMQDLLTCELWGEARHTKDMSTSELALLIDHTQMRAAEMGIYDDK